MTFFTSDTHFGHANILRYTSRPFQNIGEMDHELIRRWNTVVGHDDIVFHLGDLCLGDRGTATKYLGMLNGYIYILQYPFHHDCSWLWKVDTVLSASQHRVMLLGQIEVIDLHDYGDRHVVVLSHYPQYRWDRGHYGSWHAYGHVHSSSYKPMPELGFAWDVGVDNNNFYPVSLAQFAEKMHNRGWKPGLKLGDRAE